MCGICGIVSTPGRPVRQIVHSMMDAMVHRGPDAGGYHQVRMSGAAEGGLGFRRLAILDLSPAGNQPMVHPVTGDTLVFNGEIYNYRRLRAEFASLGATFRGTSDSEVLLEGLVRHGEAILPRLHGMYSLAFHRARDGKMLFARDPMGIKPLYVSRVPGMLVFASEIGVLLASGMVPDDLDIAGAAGMLAYGAVQSPLTVFKHVRSFPAGHYQWIDGTEADGVPPAPPERFWSYAPTTGNAVDAPARVRDLLEQSVASHIRADVPVGVFLSAGIDSTLVATLAASLTPKVTAFTVGFERELGEDEVAIASATAHELGMKHVSVVVETASVIGAWGEWLKSMDSPSIDGFNTWLVSDALAREGVTVGLSGLGADELFGGYGTLQRVNRLASMLRKPFLPLLVRSLEQTGLAGLLDRRTSVEKLADIASGGRDLESLYLGTRRVVSNRWLRAFGLSSDALGLTRNWLEPSRPTLGPADERDAFNLVARMESSHYMENTLLRDTDANSMRHSLEVRVPFLDLPLVDYVSSLPQQAKMGQTPGKKLLREGFDDILPRAVTMRKKTGFMLPYGAWMVGPMRDLCEAAVSSLASRPEIDGNAVRRLWKGFLDAPQATYWSRPLALVVLGNYLATIGRRRAA